MTIFSAFKSQVAKEAFNTFGTRSRMFSSQASGSSLLQNSSVLLLLAGGGGLLAYADTNTSKESEAFEVSSKHPKKKKLVVLGTGWAGTTFLRNVDSSKYNIEVVSPRNYFTFTPLLPSVTCGVVEARSIAEPIRRIAENKGEEIKYWEAQCLDIDVNEQKIVCQPRSNATDKGKENFQLDYDYLIIAVGARSNTFNIPGVVEHCHFLKEIEDAQKIRTSILDNFERASLPHLTDEERRKILQFVVVGGGPAGVEFAAALHDYIYEDLVKLYPSVKDFVKISVIEAGDHILNMFDQRISRFAEEKFHRDGIEVLTGSQVVKVTDDSILMKNKGHNEPVSMSYGMIVWATGIGTLPVISQFMKKIGQNGRRVLATDEWLRVKGCDNVYALGDCASIDQRKIMEDIALIFRIADKDNSGTLTVEEFNDVLKAIRERYPQINLYLKRKKMKDVTKLLEKAEESEQEKKIEINIEQFKTALSEVDSQMKALPSTAQVAAQQGYYLAGCFNKMDKAEAEPEGPLRVRGSGHHRFRPFQYKHFGQFAPLGSEQTAAQLPGDWVSIGKSTQWLWYSVYASKQISWRTRALVVFDWSKKFVFGRDSSRI